MLCLHNCHTFRVDGERERLVRRRAVPPVLQRRRERSGRRYGRLRAPGQRHGVGEPRLHRLLVLSLQPLVVARRLVSGHREPVRSPHGAVETAQFRPRHVDVETAVDVAPDGHVDDTYIGVCRKWFNILCFTITLDLHCRASIRPANFSL